MGGYAAFMNESIVVRPAEDRDLPELGRLGAMLLRTHYAFDTRRFMAPVERPDEGYSWFLGTQLHEEGVVILVAEDCDELVGYVYAGVEEKSRKELREAAGFIHDVVVTERVRRHGLAEKLIEAAAEWLVARGVERVMLWAAEVMRWFDVPTSGARGVAYPEG